MFSNDGIKRSCHSTIGGGIKRYCHSICHFFESDGDIVVEECDLDSQKTLLGDKFNTNELEKLIHFVNPDIIHLNGYTSLIIGQVVRIAYKNGIKIVYTAHWHPFRTMRLSVLKHIYFNLFIRPSIPLMDTIVTINDEDTLFFKDLHKNVYQIPNGLALNFPHIKVSRKANMVLLVAGRLDYRNKGIEHIYHLPVGEYEIHCVGTGTIPSRSDITMHTNISDGELAELYSQASLCVVPSRYEAFSYAALEALYFGTPVLASQGVRILDYLKDVPYIQSFKYHNFSEFVARVRTTIGKTFTQKGFLNQFMPSVIKEKYKALYLSVKS